MDLTRRVFDWKVDILEEFLVSFERIVLMEETRDRVVWTSSCSGRFTCGLFRKCIFRVGKVSVR